MSAVAAPILVGSHPVIEVGDRVAGTDPQELVARFGSPLFVYDLDVLTSRVAALRSALPARTRLAFAVKANPSMAVLAHLARLGVGADVASGGELEAALLAGIPRRRIVFTGPGKTDAELERALRVGIGAITVESLDELDALFELAPAARGRQGLFIRLAVEGAGETVPIIGGPGAAKFGLLPDEVDLAIERLRDGPYELLGLHAFGASNLLDADRWVDGLVELGAQGETIARRHEVDIAVLDAGGGLGVPYRDDERPVDLDRLRDRLDGELATWRRRPGLGSTTLLVEPGRYLAAPIGALLVRVTRTKPRGDRIIAVTDGGIHHLLRPALLGSSQRVVPVRPPDGANRPKAIVDVVGPLCTGLDVLASGVVMLTPRRGDLLAVLDAGAYGFTESMPLFLSHPQAAEVTVCDGVSSLARPRSEPVETLARQRLAAPGGRCP